MPVSCDELLELRRNAYIECTNLYLEKNNVVGIFGDGVSQAGDLNLPLAKIYACGLVPIPIEGVDSAIFEFGDEKGVCDVIKSTLIYLKTDKCPLLFSSRMYVITNYCYNFIQKLKDETTKPVFTFDVTKKNPSDQKKQEKNLVEMLCKVYSCEYSEDVEIKATKKLKYIDAVLEQLENYSDLDAKQLFLLRYFTPYITDLNTRVDFFEKLEKKITFNDKKNNRKILRAICPRGNYKSILKNAKDKNIIILRAFSTCDVGYEKCMLSKCEQIYGYI